MSCLWISARMLGVQMKWNATRERHWCVQWQVLVACWLQLAGVNVPGASAIRWYRGHVFLYQRTGTQRGTQRRAHMARHFGSSKHA